MTDNGSRDLTTVRRLVTMQQRLLVGSYTRDGRGSGQGITTFDRAPSNGALTPTGLAASISDPSYLTWHPDGRHLYSVSELTDGAVAAFEISEDGTLTALGEQPTGGADPCHLTVDPSGRYLITANYTGGSIAVHPIAPDGVLRPRCDLVRHLGGGPVAGRQDGPHVHMVRFTPDGRHLLAVDLGHDAVHAYRLSGRDGNLTPVKVSRLPPGTGPRHLAFAATGLVYLVGELSATVTTLRLNAESGELTRLSEAPLTGSDTPDLGAAVLLSHDERFVYVSSRGPDTVTVFAVDGDELRTVAEIPAGGAEPRDIAIVDDHLYTTGQSSNTVSTFRLDPDTGIPELTGTIDVPTPVRVLAVP